METFDNEAAKRVWERVRSREPLSPQDMALPGLIREELTDAAAYLRLSRRFQGGDAALLRRLSEEAKAHAACLRGINALLTGETPRFPPVPQSPAPPEILLRRCCANALRRAGEYERHAGHPEYGAVFQALAAQKNAHCQKLLQLLGTVLQ